LFGTRGSLDRLIEQFRWLGRWLIATVIAGRRRGFNSYLSQSITHRDTIALGHQITLQNTANWGWHIHTCFV
jgi:hypothetical protein